MGGLGYIWQGGGGSRICDSLTVLAGGGMAKYDSDDNFKGGPSKKPEFSMT